jgi:hypothetical protein
VAIVVLGLSWAMFGPKGKKGPAAPPGGGAPVAKAPPPPAEKPKTPIEVEADLAGMEVPKWIDAMVSRASQSPQLAKSTWEEMRRLGREDAAARTLAAGKKAWPHDPWINGTLGLKDRTKEIQEAGDSVEMQDLLADFPDYQRIAELREQVTRVSGSGWVDAETSTKLDGWLKGSRERLTWLKDPVNERTQRLLTNLKFDPHFAKRSFGASVARPYTIFVEEAEPDGRDAVRKEADRAGKALTGGYRRFLAFLRTEVGLGDAPKLEDLNDTRLRAFLFRSRRSFDQWHLDAGDDVPSKGVLAYFTAVQGMIVLHAELDSGSSSGVKGTSQDTATFLHEGVHQLYDWYQRFYCDRAGKRIPEGYAAMSPTRATPDTFFWFQEGLADYFGAAKPVPGHDDDWEPGQPDLGHLETLAWAKTQKQEWKVSEFLFADQSEIYDRAEAKNWGRRGADNLKALMYAHGWCMTHFLLHGDGGKWRGKFLEYIRRDLRGDHFRSKLDDLKRDLPGFEAVLKANPEYADALRDRKDMVLELAAFIQRSPEFAKYLRIGDFLDAFGLPKDPANPSVQAWMKELEAGYRRYADELLKARGGR